MPLPVVTADVLKRDVHFADLVEPVSVAFQDHSNGRAKSQFMVMYPGERPELGDVFLKTGSASGHGIYIVKVSPWFACNVAAGRPQGGLIAAFDTQTGHTRAILADDHYLSDIRTAAAGVLAARTLAPKAVEAVAVLGTGVQAFWQPQALFAERRFAKLLIWGRDSSKAAHLAERLALALPGVEVEVDGELHRAVSAADVVLATTASAEPIIRGEWLRPGQHITAIGADDGHKCELDAACFRRADRIVVDCRDSAVRYGDVSRHVASGALSPCAIQSEIGEILSGTADGRRGDAEITIAKFVGIGAQDLAAAEVSLRKLKL